MPVVLARGIVKGYLAGGATLTVLRDLDLQVDAGEMVAIVGASGVGKSTLLHLLGGLDRVDAGTILIAGCEVTSLADAAVVAFRNSQVGFVFQFHHLLPEFSALENVEMPMRIARVAPSQARPRAEEILRRVGSRTDRPLLAADSDDERLAKIRALLDERAATYGLATHRIDTTGRPVDEVVEQIRGLVGAE